MKLLRALIIAAVAAGACKPTPPPPGSTRKMASQVISASYDPSVSGLPGPVGEVVEVAGGATAWVKYGTGVTQWQAFPGSGSGGGIADGGVSAPLSGAGSVANPLAIAAATTSAAGSLSAADKVLLNGLTAGNWYGLRKAEMLAAVPQLTEFKYVTVGVEPFGVSPSASVNIGTAEGGSMTGADTTVTSFASPIFQTPKTGKWAIVFRAKLTGPTSGKNNQVGIVNVGETHNVIAGSIFADDATHYVLRIFGAGSTEVVSTTVGDGALHNFMLTGNGTNVTLKVDNVQVATTSTLTNLSDEAMGPFLFNTTSGQTSVTQVAWGYIAP